MKITIAFPRWSTTLALAILLSGVLLFLGSTDRAQSQRLQVSDSPTQLKQFAYVSIVGEDRISVIDVQTNMEVSTVAVGDEPRGIVAHPGGCCVYVVNHFSNSVSVIDVASNKVTATIPVGVRPWEIVISSDGKRVYVSNLDSETISVINTTNNSVIATIALGTLPLDLERPSGMAISLDGTRVYATRASGSGLIWVIDTTKNQVVKNLYTCSQPTELSISPDGSRLYVTVIEASMPCPEDVIVVLDTNSGNEICTTYIGEGPDGTALSPDGASLYIAKQFANQVMVMNAATCQIESPAIPVGTAPTRIAIAPTLNRAYVVNFGGGISVIDMATRMVIATIPTGIAPQGITITPLLSQTDAKITIVKDAMPNSPRNFRFYGPFGEFRLDNPTVDDVDGIGERMTYQVVPGTYGFSEMQTDGWRLTDILCSKPERATVNLQQHSLILTLQAGDDVTCTFVNKQAVTVYARAYWDKNGSRFYDVGEPWKSGVWTEIVDGAGKRVAANFTDNNGQVGAFNLAPGAYAVCQTPPSGWWNTQPGKLDPRYGKPCYSFNVAPAGLVTGYFGWIDRPVVYSAEEEMEDVGGLEVSVFETLEEETASGNGSVYLPLIRR